MNYRVVSCDWLSAKTPIDEPLLREMLSFDMQCSKSIEFVRDKADQVAFALPPSTMHWSRIWEWPWAINAVPLAGKTVLNAGGGHSVMTCSLAKRCLGVVVADLDADSLRHVGKEPPFNRFDNITVCLQDLTELPAGWKDKYDVVQCVSVLEHVPDYRKALGEMLRVLKPGGQLVLTCDCEIVPAGGYRGPLEKCPKWDLTGMGPDLLQQFGRAPNADRAMIGLVSGQLFMVLAAVLEKL